MAYAVIEDGRVKVYGVLPGAYHSEISNVIGGFDKLPDSELERHGFYPVEYPTINQRTQQRGDIYFDEAEKKYKYRVTDKSLPSVDSLKQNKLTQLKQQKTRFLEVTNEDVLEHLEAGESVPTEISASRAEIRTQAIEIENEINNITTHDSIYDYNRSFHLVKTGSIKY